jgi:hypothetical protein
VVLAGVRVMVSCEGWTARRVAREVVKASASNDAMSEERVKVIEIPSR